jgi:hypothetical protein
MGHFSRFVAPGAVHLYTGGPAPLASAGFANPDGGKVLVVHNPGSAGAAFTLRWNRTQAFAYSLPAGATATFTWTGDPEPPEGLMVDAGGPGDSGEGGEAVADAGDVDASAARWPAPPAVYATARRGDAFAYSFAGLQPGAAYTVRLHFAERQATQPGERRFDVLVNGLGVLAGFDQLAEAGGAGRALVRESRQRASPEGVLRLEFRSVVGAAEVRGIEVLPDSK